MISLKNIVHAIATPALLLISVAATANSQSLPKPDLVNGGNLWNITAFNDADPFHGQMATQGICFEFIGMVGTHARYRWRSTTFKDWNGIASQEGDQVFMHGDYDKDIGHDGIMWSLDTFKTGSGHWTEWREDGGFGNTIVFANETFQRVGSCPVYGTTIPDVPLQFAPDGSLMENPLGNVKPTVPER